jgi:hypothetical protein
LEKTTKDTDMKETLTPTDKRKNGLIKKYHALIRDAKISEEQKFILLSNWNVSSSKDMTVEQLIQVCEFLDHLVDPELAELEKWREWVRTCVKSYGKVMGANYTDEYAEGIVCAATKIDNFNDISKKRLQGIYNHFKKSKSDAIMAKEIIMNDVKAIASLN